MKECKNRKNEMNRNDKMINEKNMAAIPAPFNTL